MNIDSIPETITRDAYTALIEGAGLSVDHLVELRFTTTGIYAQVYVSDDLGHHVLSNTGVGETPELAKHEVFVRVVDA